jgi:drug/metabolite transporter (DMT)-like permease
MLLYLILAVCFNLLLLVIIKYFERFKIPSLQGIVFNYFFAGTTAILFNGNNVNVNEIIQADYFPVSLLLGSLFISVFYIISLTAQRLGIAVASVANKMSVVIPVIAAFIFYNDSITFLKIIAIIIALIAVYFSTISEKKHNDAKNNLTGFLFPILIFFGSGIIDALVNYANKKLIHNESENALFSALLFFVAGLIGVVCLCYQIFIKKQTFQFKSIIGGLVLGIPNFFSIYFILKALETGILESSVLYPILNILIVASSAIVGFLLFKEKLNKINIAGLILSLISISLLMI